MNGYLLSTLFDLTYRYGYFIPTIFSGFMFRNVVFPWR